MEIKVLESWAGMGRWWGITVTHPEHGDVTIWSHASAMDGPLDEETTFLVNQLANWQGGFINVDR